LNATNGTRPLPNFVRPTGDKAPRFTVHSIYSQLASYQFTCYGVVTEWRAIIDSSVDDFDITFFVWRPSAFQLGSNEFLSGSNEFFSSTFEPLFDSETGLFTGVPPVGERIEFQPGDIVELFLNGTDAAIFFAADEDNSQPYINERILSDNDTNLDILSPMLTSSTNRAPLISVVVNCKLLKKKYTELNL